MDQASVSTWIAQLKAADADAARKIWHRYASDLLAAARQRLPKSVGPVADEEDVAQSVFRSVCRGAAAGRLEHVLHREQLWWLLLAITKQKIIDRLRSERALKRGSGRVRSESSFQQAAAEDFSLDNLVGHERGPEFAVMLEEQSSRLLSLLREDELRQIAISRMDGYSNAEIAAELGISTRTVERKLRLIRGRWSQELAASQ